MVGRSAAMFSLMHEVAERGASAARENAPVATGAYRDGIEAQVGIGTQGSVTGRVNAKDFKSAFVEFGTYKWPAHATLRRAVESIGLGLAKGP